MKNLDGVLQDSVALVRQTADYIKKEQEGFSRDKVEYKGRNDLVSYVDKEAERILVEGLSKILPDADFITEEGTAEEGGKELTWIIDPLDGTTNFIHGLPDYAVSVALRREDQIVLGIIHEINHAETFYSAEGGLAYCNDRKISVSPNLELSSSLMATGFPYHSFEYMDRYLSLLHAFMEASHGIRRWGSAAVDLAYVACGRFDGFFEYNLNAWDVAAGAFLVQQAGGTVTDFSGGTDYIFGKQIIAANGVYEDMLKILQSKWFPDA